MEVCARIEKMNDGKWVSDLEGQLPPFIGPPMRTARSETYEDLPNLTKLRVDTMLPKMRNSPHHQWLGSDSHNKYDIIKLITMRIGDQGTNYGATDTNF